MNRDIVIVAARIVSTCFRELGLVEDASGRPPALAQLLGPGESPARPAHTEPVPDGRNPRRPVRNVMLRTGSRSVRQARKRRISSSDAEDDEEEAEDNSSGSVSDDDDDIDSSDSERPKPRRNSRAKKMSTRPQTRISTRSRRKE